LHLQRTPHGLVYMPPKYDTTILPETRHFFVKNYSLVI
jgi:hypothetical protein